MMVMMMMMATTMMTMTMAMVRATMRHSCHEAVLLHGESALQISECRELLDPVRE
jgi:hypothetical protein